MNQNRKPISLSAAQKILSEYYKQRADQYKKETGTSKPTHRTNKRKIPDQTINPLTGRKIVVDGQTYKKLKDKGLL